ncbi:serine hydrolase [Sandaracinobacter neustonicus]|uniref:Serine hydrolase n=1 Tax=Sandaracinobacter neustonicus TaxID=1715348 RepID=A0A501XCW8_9SPHN|nr:serine hydrolase [Sandaracinobacter neustonicus]TPE58458.1 serine hydrolase [Sandaracinobacter neustonicus]
MAGADRGGLCGGHDGQVRHPATPEADRARHHAGWKPVLAALTAFALAAPSFAQVAPNARTLALAAGWKAGFLCSGLFVAGLDEATVTANDLQAAYTDLAPHIAGLPARIDRTAKRVEVGAGDAAPPRVAQFVEGRGCVQLPIGAGLSQPPSGGGAGQVPMPPSLIGGPDVKAMDARIWPQGDRLATASLPAAKRRALDLAVADAFTGTRFGANGRTSALLVVQDGKIVSERYARGIGMHTPQRTFSVAKSLAAALIGRAVALGVIDVMAPAHVPEWAAAGDPRAVITVDQLLRMQSGLWTNGPGNRTDSLYFGGSTVPETAGAAPLEVRPASRFNYANNDTLLAARALDTDLGEAAPSFAYTHLLWPLGMTRTTIESDWQGNPILSSQVWMTARDMARLALLHLNNGAWNGQQLLPENWVREATTPTGPQPAGRNGEGYGRAIWLLGPAQGLPEGSYAFIGNQGQFALIVPSRKLVIIRRAFDPPGTDFQFMALAKEVAAALE